MMRLCLIFLLFPVLALTQPNSDSIRISIPDTTISVGDSVSIPIRVSDLSGHNIISYEFSFSYSPATLRYIGLDEQRTLSSDGKVMDNPDSTSGRVKAAGIFVKPLTGAGTLLYLRFIPQQPDTLSLRFSNVVFNTENISQINGGRIIVQP